MPLKALVQFSDGLPRTEFTSGMIPPLDGIPAVQHATAQPRAKSVTLADDDAVCTFESSEAEGAVILKKGKEKSTSRKVGNGPKPSQVAGPAHRHQGGIPKKKPRAKVNPDPSSRVTRSMCKCKGMEVMGELLKIYDC